MLSFLIDLLTYRIIGYRYSVFYKKTEVLLPVLVVDMFEIFTTQRIATILMLDGRDRHGNRFREYLF